MPAYVVPAYMKPRSKIATWLLPMIYIDTDMVEYICDVETVRLVIKDKIVVYNSYSYLVMKTDLEGRASQLKVKPDSNSRGIAPIEEFVRKATQGRSLMEIEGSFDLYAESGDELIRRVYKATRPDLRSVVATPLQWLVWYPREKLLTRLCWVRRLDGKIVVRPYGSRNFMLEVADGKLELEAIQGNPMTVCDTFELKKGFLMKMRLVNEWRSLVATELLEEESGLEVAEEGLPIEETPRAGPSDIGEVE